MPLQTTGPISLQNVQGEFGGSNPISISEYYGADTGVPSSGPISLSDFYGKSAGGGVDTTFETFFTSANFGSGGSQTRTLGTINQEVILFYDMPAGTNAGDAWIITQNGTQIYNGPGGFSGSFGVNNNDTVTIEWQGTPGGSQTPLGNFVISGGGSSANFAVTSAGF